MNFINLSKIIFSHNIIFYLLSTISAQSSNQGDPCTTDLDCNADLNLICAH